MHPLRIGRGGMHPLLLIALAAAAAAALDRCCSSSGGALATTGTGTGNGDIVILVSSDGFRWSYQDKVPTPSMDRLKRSGTVSSKGLIPVFPSSTFSSHYSIVTGLYPAWHGIVGNVFRDPDTGAKFLRNDNNPKWWLGEPLWETVVRHGLVAASFFWPGSEVTKGPWTCSRRYCHAFNISVPFEVRVDSVLAWLDLPPKQRPSFVAMYFDEPDAKGHLFGTDTPQIDAAITKFDAALGRLLDGIQARKTISGKVSVIVVGDHGMVSTCEKRYIYLEDLAPWIDIQSSWVDYAGGMLSISPPEGGPSAETIVHKMKTGLASGKVTNGEHLKVYLKEDLPKRLKYHGSNRIQPVIGMASEGYRVVVKRPAGEQCGGGHGYDNALMSMRTIFMAQGPRFAKGKRVYKAFENVEVYNIVTSILGIRGAPNNGSDAFSKKILL